MTTLVLALLRPVGRLTHLQTVPFLPLPDHAELPLALSGALPQGRQQQAALAASQEEGARQAEEVVRGGPAHPGRLQAELLVPRAELVAQQAEEPLDLGLRQHRFDKMGEGAGVHLHPKREENLRR